MIDHKSHEVEIRCRPSKLPDHIEVDVKDLVVGGGYSYQRPACG